MGYSLVHGAWVDRVAEEEVGGAAPSPRAGDGMADAFPLHELGLVPGPAPRRVRGWVEAVADWETSRTPCAGCCTTARWWAWWTAGRRSCWRTSENIILDARTLHAAAWTTSWRVQLMEDRRRARAV